MAAKKKKATTKAVRKKATSSKPGAKARPDSRVAQESARLDRLTVDLICNTAKNVHKEILKQNKPDLTFPVRSLKNVSYSTKRGYFEIGKQKKTRTLTVNTVKSFAQTLRMMGLSKELVESNDFATKRDAYYQSKNWNEAKFDEQTESDTVMDDIEALFSLRGASREQLRFVPDEHGGAVAGRLIVLDPDRETGEIERIDCTRFGSGAYSIPSSVEQLSFETDAKFILAIETGGVFQRLQSHKFWQSSNCILISMAGVPRLRPLRHLQHLSHAEGRFGKRRSPLPVLLRPPGELSGRHAPGHHRLRIAHPSASRCRHQARQGRAQERSLLPRPQAVAEGDRAVVEDGGAR